MKVTVNLSKAELDLIEEALLRYQEFLLNSDQRDEMIEHELLLCKRVLEEFGMEDLAEEYESQSPSLSKPGQFPFSR
jgi:hypothetical protein